MSVARAQFRADFDLSSVDVRVENDTFCGHGTVVFYEDNVRRLREFASALRPYPLQESTVEISDPGSVVLTASRYDLVGHVALLVQVSAGPCLARIAIRLDHPGLELFSRQLTKMLDGELEAFELVQSVT